MRITQQETLELMEKTSSEKQNNFDSCNNISLSLSTQPHHSNLEDLAVFRDSVS